MAIDPTRLHPAIFVGFGGVGAEVVVALRRRLLAATRDDPMLRHELLDTRFHFITVDTSRQQMGEGAEGIHHVGIPIEGNTQALVASLHRGDECFDNWWYPGYPNPGNLVLGAGMVPINGKLCWAQDYRLNDLIQHAITEAAHRATNVLNENAVHGEFWVFFISSVCGGTGAGVVLPAAFNFASAGFERAQVFGLFMLPSAVERRPVDTSQNRRLWANGAATLLTLDYWMEHAPNRPFETEPFYCTGAGRQKRVLSGVPTPIQIAFLFTNRNANGQTLAHYSDYASMMADGLTELLFSATAQQDLQNANNFMNAVGAAGSWGGRCQRFGSFGLSRLRFPGEAVTQYLSYILGRRLLRDTFLTPWTPEDEGEDALQFMADYKLREEGAFNEVIDSLRARRADLMPQDEIDLAENLDGVSPESVADIVKGLIAKQEVILGYREPDKKTKANLGPTFADLLSENRREIAVVVTNAIQDALKGYLGSDDRGFQRARAMLRELVTQLKAQKAAISGELNGNVDRNASEIGLMRAENNSRRNLSEELDTLISGLGRPLRKRQAVQHFVEAWWLPWVRQVKGIVLRREALRFYDDLLADLRAYENAAEKIETAMRELEVEWNTAARESLTSQQLRDNTITAVEERVLALAEHINRAFPLPKVGDSAQGVAAAIATQQAGNLMEGLDALHDLTLSESEDVVSQATRSAKAALASRILAWSRGEFEPQVRQITIWEAIAREAGFNPPGEREELTPEAKQRLMAEFNRRLIANQGRCAAFWEVIESKVAGAQPQLADVAKENLTTYSFDSWNKFCARYKWSDAPAPQALDKANDMPDGQMVTSMQMQGGRPIYALLESDRLLNSLQHFQAGPGSPVFSDRRLDEHLARTWEPYSRRDDQRLLFMLAEWLGVISSPLRNESKRAAYKITSTKQTLERGRYDAQVMLMENPQFRQVVTAGVRQKWFAMGTPDKKALLSEMADWYAQVAPRTGSKNVQMSVDRYLIDCAQLRPELEEELYCVLRRDQMAAEMVRDQFSVVNKLLESGDE